MKKYSKLIALATIIVLAVGITVLVVALNSIQKDAEFALGDYTVVAQGAGVAIVNYTGDETAVTIPSTIDKKKIVAIKAEAFKGTKVVSVKFENGSIDLEDSVFNGNTTIQEVTLPQNITYVPKNCFMNCTALVKVTMPDTITYIGEFAFYGCTNLTKLPSDVELDGLLALPKSLKEVCNNAFYECKEIETVKVSDKLERIGDNAFRSSGISKLELYDSETRFAIKELGKNAFYNTILKSDSTSNILDFPALQTIGDYAFGSISSNFKTFKISPTVTTVGEYAFAKTSSLESITFEKEEGEQLDITVGKYAFSDCTALTKVEFNRDINKIPEGMFMGCINLLKTNDLVLSENVDEIGDGAFALFVGSGTKNCNRLIKFKYTDAQGEVSAVPYNETFRITQLQLFKTSSKSECVHFVLTDYNITELYAYVGLYDTNSNWTYDGDPDASAFKFLIADGFVPGTTDIKHFDTLNIIHSKAFAGAQFDKLCLQGKTCVIQKEAFYKSAIDTFYIDSSCMDYTCSINVDAFDNLNTDIKEKEDDGSYKVNFFVKGAPERDKFENSDIKKQLLAIREDFGDLTGDEWPR